jgi:hypothetical protein
MWRSGTGRHLGEKSVKRVNGNDAVSDEKISKFFVSQVEESMAGHMGVVEFTKVRRGITKVHGGNR